MFIEFNSIEGRGRSFINLDHVRQVNFQADQAAILFDDDASKRPTIVRDAAEIAQLLAAVQSHGRG